MWKIVAQFSALKPKGILIRKSLVLVTPSITQDVRTFHFKSDVIKAWYVIFVSLIKQPYNLSSSLLIFLRVKITWLPVCLPDTLPVYAAGVLTGSGLPLKKDTSNPGGLSKAKGVTANPHSTLVNDDEKAQVKFTEQPAVPLTTFPLYEDVKLWFTARKVKN